MSQRRMSGRKVPRAARASAAVATAVTVAPAWVMMSESASRVSASSSTSRTRSPSRLTAVPATGASATGPAGATGRRRQRDDERRTLSVPRTAGLHLAPVQLRHVADDREPETETACRPTRGAVGLPERLEHVRQEVARDAGPRVADADLHARTGSFELYLHAAARRGE